MRCRDDRTEDRIAKADRLWFFLDYDGTLADFAETPDQVEVQPEIVGILTRLVQLPGVRVSVVSGRKLDHIKRLVPVPEIFLAGTYGIECRSFEGEDFHRLELNSIRPEIEALKPILENLISGKEGFYLEDKGWSLALHAGHATEDLSEQILSSAEQILRKSLRDEDFAILGGHKFLEICPGSGDKGATVRFLLSEYPWSGALLVYLGDDDKDEKAFKVIEENQGVSIRVGLSVGEHPSDCRLDDPGDVRRWLLTLIERRESDRIDK